MKFPLTLSWHISKRFLIYMLIALCACWVLIILIDAIELLRRTQNKDIPTDIFIQMLILKFPLFGQKIIPFAILIATILTFNQLSRFHELEVIKAAGISIWQMLIGPATITILVSIIFLTFINPLACTMLTAYERLETRYLIGKSSMLSLGKSGLWLRQVQLNLNTANDPESEIYNTDGDLILHAQSVPINTATSIVLKEVNIYQFNNVGLFYERLDAEMAKLLDNFWHLKNVTISRPNGSFEKLDEYFLETDFTVDDINNSFVSPETVSFWALAEFIETITKTGFSALPHRLHWHQLLSSPLLYIGMLLLATSFSLQPARKGRQGLLIALSVLIGFLVYFLVSVIASFGLSGTLPVAIAAWIPPVMVTLLGIGVLVHVEEG